MDLFNTVLEKFGFKAALVLYVVKTIYELIIGATKKYIKTINENTQAINDMRVETRIRLDKIDRDLQIAFFNIEDINQGKNLKIPEPRKDQ